MLDYSSAILEAMKYVDVRISSLHPESLDRNRLQSKIRVQIVANIKKISAMDINDAHKEIDRIVNTQLLKEIARHI